MSNGVEAGRNLSDGLEHGEVIASRYVVERPWRSHPLGVLYRCTDLTCGTQVLLQRLRREFADPRVADHLFDTRGRAALGSRLIPDILDYGADFDGRPFLVTRTYEARTLAELERPIAFEEAVEIVESIAAALIPAHVERLVHGGIEPESVLIERDADGRPRVVALLGFGLVPALAVDKKSKHLPLLMAPTHVAPELVRGAPMSPAADVYALGILLWELIYGAPPFRGPTLRVLDAHTSRALPELELPFDAPSAFDWVLRRMLSKNAVDRFANAEAVVEQLGPFVDGIPDLTLDLDPDSCPAPVALPLYPELEAVPLAEDDDEEDTVIFDRYAPQPVASASATAIVLDEPPLLVPGRPNRAKMVALLTIAAALVLVSVQAIINARIDTAAERAELPEATQAVASTADEPVTSTAVVPPPPPTAPAEPPAKPLPHKLGNDDFRAEKAPLHARVEHRCLGDRVRRIVKVGVRVSSDGKVDSTTVLGAMAGTGLGRCVEQEAAKLEFPATKRGGYFVYTLRLR